VPWHDEFLRPSGSELQGLDDWLFRNAHGAVPRLEDEGRFAQSGAYAFLMDLDEGSSLPAVTGALCQSCDSAGRAYPLAVAASVTLEDGVRAHPETAPILLDAFWQDAVEVLSAFSSARPTGEDALIERGTGASLEPVGAASALYTRWAQQTTVGELCTLLDRPLAWVSGAVWHVSGLAATAAEPRRKPSFIRLPLGRAGGSALCFWLDVLRRSPGWSARVPSFFWSHDGESGDAVLCTGAPGESTLAALWRPDLSSDPSWDFVRDDPGPPPTTALLEPSDEAVSLFIQRLASRSSSTA
jgi:hypothetical protein